MGRSQTAWAATFAALVMLALAARPSVVAGGGDWNDAGIKWQSYEDGLAAAKKAKKPVCLVFYTDWCPHCKNYSGVFHDQRVVEKAKNFIMIRLNGDQSKELSKQYAPDGAYIPRTFFLSSQGQLDSSIQARADRFKYFYDEHKAEGLLAGMDAALKKLR